MHSGTVVFGTVFMDCKGFAANRYDPLGRTGLFLWIVRASLQTATTRLGAM